MKIYKDNRYPRDAMTAVAGIIIDVMDAADPSSAGDPVDLHARIGAKFEAVVKSCRIGGLPSDAALDLLYPLAALTDEAMLRDPRYSYYWAGDSMQLRYFGEMLAGAVFFEKLEKLMGAGEGRAELLEVYHACLALGFSGMYGVGGERRSKVIYEDLGVALADIRAKRADGFLTPSSDSGISPWIMVPVAAFILTMAAAAIIYLFALAGFTDFLDDFL